MAYVSPQERPSSCGQSIQYDVSGGDRSLTLLKQESTFPFADGLNELIKVGVKCIIQPGGSIKDDEVIAAAEKAGIAMIFTGIRNFRH